MNLLKIAGVVAALHVVILVPLLLSPGCRSAGTSEPRVEATAPAPSPEGGGDRIDPTPIEPMAAESATLDGYGGPGYGGGASAPSAFTTAGGTGERLPPTRPTPEQLGVKPPPPPDLEYTVRPGDSLYRIARSHGVTIEDLTTANRIPRTATLQVGQKIMVPGKGTPVTPDVAAPEVVGGAGSMSGAAATGTLPYTVRPGDSLIAIAKKYNTSASALREANGIQGDRIEAGQVLQVPVGSGSRAAVSPGTPQPPSAVVRPPPVPGRIPETHVVAAGETLGAIARRYGVSAADIMRLNGITDTRRIQVGAVLRLPQSAAQSSPDPVPSSTGPTPPPPTGVTPAEPVPVEPVPVVPVPIQPIEDAPPAT